MHLNIKENYFEIGVALEENRNNRHVEMIYIRILPAFGLEN
jgi:hypothetical protein